MSTFEAEANKVLTKRLFTALEVADTAVIGELIADDLVDHSPMFGRNAFEREQLIDAAVTFKRAFPDVRIATEHVIAENDRVVVSEFVTGTNTGPFREAEPTGRRMTVRATHVLRIAGGKVVEHWAVRELEGMVSALSMG
ncbi:ester cyclase [Nocardia sp. NBC_01499]|uniref:ester cyclase n=1 Tax=Nocardia sp. NBC_01499 TaxID=2903597 RepID=UPI00386AE9AE